MVSQVSFAPSVGQIGVPYYDARNDRVKYFSTNVVETESELGLEVSKLMREMERSNATRASMRLLTSLQGICNREANVPLAGDFSGLNLVYIGFNSEGRLTPNDILHEEYAAIERISSQVRRLRPIDSSRFSIENLRSYSPQDVSDLVELYRVSFPTYTVELNENSVRQMLDGNRVIVARDANTERIVSCFMGEVARVPLSETQNFDLVEFSEGATLPQYQGNGLLQACTKALVEDVSSVVDLMYAECRANHVAINKAMWNLGFDFAGLLPQHCVISGQHEIDQATQYGDLSVMYLNA
jgi:hypothetical protein